MYMCSPLPIYVRYCVRTYLLLAMPLYAGILEPSLHWLQNLQSVCPLFERMCRHEVSLSSLGHGQVWRMEGRLQAYLTQVPARAESLPNSSAGVIGSVHCGRAAPLCRRTVAAMDCPHAGCIRGGGWAVPGGVTISLRISSCTWLR